MKMNLLFFLLCNFSYNINAQDSIELMPDKMPEYMGGVKKMYEFIQENIKYPEEAVQKNIQGTVYCKFIVEKTGKLSNIEIIKGIGGGCDEEALRVLTMMINWTPGFKSNEPVRVYFTLPIKFGIKAAAQGQNPIKDSNEVGIAKMPEYPEGMEAFYEFITKNIYYPKKAREAGIHDTVKVAFIVEKNGVMSNFKIIKSIGGGCDEEALRVLGLMQSWKPGYNTNNEPVRMKFTLPIIFNTYEHQNFDFVDFLKKEENLGENIKYTMKKNMTINEMRYAVEYLEEKLKDSHEHFIVDENTITAKP